MMRVQHGFMFNIAWNLWGLYKKKKNLETFEKSKEKPVPWKVPPLGTITETKGTIVRAEPKTICIVDVDASIWLPWL